MRSLLQSATFFLALSLVAPSAFSQEFTLANLSVGMTPADVEVKMAEIGYLPYSKSGKTNAVKALTFAQQVKKKQGEYLSRRDGEGLKSLSFSKNEREFVTVKFEQYPSGQFVSSIAYILNDKTLDASKFKDRVYKKYGKPISDNPMAVGWRGDQNMMRDGIRAAEHLAFFPRDYMMNLSAPVSRPDYDRALTLANPKSSDETTF